MGTRHLICAAKNGEYRLAQYGQWDGYPEGQGADVLAFLRSGSLQILKSKLDLCRWITEDEYDARWKEFGVDVKNERYVSGDISKKFYDKYPELDRSTGADILRLIADSDGEVYLMNDIGFAKDSLFCEWAYVIDFDRNTFEVYRGFNKELLCECERFYSFNPIEDGVDTVYCPVKLLASFCLDDLPDEDAFIKACNDIDKQS